MSHFRNKVVWITGASSGIGEALAYRFANEGARLILSARRSDELERVKKTCNLPDDRVLTLPMDVSQIEQIPDKAKIALERFGKVDVLVNNAGVSHWMRINELSMEVLHKVMTTNFTGSVALTKAVLPGMLEQKSGQIIVISSILGKIVTAKQAAYNASKHALHGFFDTLRAEYGKSGIKVLIVCPGFVRTNVARNSLDRDGNPINKQSPLIENGLDPAYVAQKIVRAAANGKEEILIAGTKEKAAVWLKRYFPALFSKIIAESRLA
ncbi:MAG: SDR family oxidoreductase [Chitinophagales bacterium]|nr:SDR family oxidoreductase [Chitinophagales bacterium]MDW8418591.1 SDR family oxidoreductase [Chitinophagales bacterium]